MDRDWNEWSPDDIMLYFAFLAELNEEHYNYSNSMFPVKLTHENTINFLIKILSQAQQLTPSWFDIMKFIVPLVNDSVIWSFMPALQTVPEQPALYPKFIELFPEIAIDVYAVGFDDSNGFLLVQEFMVIFINMIDKLFSENVDEYQALQFASQAWTEIIDYNDDFFFSLNEVFLSTLLQKFFITLRLLVIDPNEFLLVACIASNNIIQIVINNTNFFPVIFQFLDIIIFAIDSNYDEFINDEVNRISLTNTILALTDFPENISPYPLCQYFAEKMKEISDGIIFTIASSAKQISDIFAPTVANRILASDPIPQSALQFVRLCNINVGPQNINGIITFTYTSFISNPSIAAIQAICELALQAPMLFVENGPKLISPLISWLQQSPPQLTLYIMTSLLYLLPSIEQPELISQILTIITKVICEQTSTLFQSDAPSMFNFIFDFVKTAKKITDNLMNEKNIIKSEDNVIVQFYFQIFDQFVNILQPFWHFQSDQIMSLLCKFLIDSIKASIVRDFLQIIKWISEALYIAPVLDHISLLKTEPIYKLLTNLDYKSQTEPIIQFIVSFPQIEDSELQREVYLFISELLKNKWDGLFQYFSIELLLAPLESNDSRIVEIAIQVIHQLITTGCFDNAIPQMLDMIVNGMFTNFQEHSIKNSIDVLTKVIASGKISVEQVLQMVFNHLGFDSPEAREFQETLTSLRSTEENDRMRVFKAARKMIVLYHKPRGQVPNSE